MTSTTAPPKPKPAKHAEKPEAEQPHVQAQEQEPDAGLFDKSDFNDPRLLLTDERGNKIDEVELTFTGKIKLDRTDPASVEFARGVILSRYHPVDLPLSGVWVERKVRLTPENPDTGKGGDRILTLKAEIDTIDLSTPTSE